MLAPDASAAVVVVDSSPPPPLVSVDSSELLSSLLHPAKSRAPQDTAMANVVVRLRWVMVILRAVAVPAG